jgi:hypothetical protein
MSLSVEVPDDVRSALEGHWGDLSRHLQENLALDGFRQGLLSLTQVRRLLGFSTRWEAQEFLGSHGVAVFDLEPGELEREARLLESIDARRRPERT